MSNLQLARKIGLWGAIVLGSLTALSPVVSGEGSHLLTAITFFVLGAIMYGAVFFVIVLGLLTLFRRGKRPTEVSSPNS